AFAFSAFVPSVASARACGGVDLPARARVGSQDLVLNGMGIREATVFNVDVYVAGLYLPERATDGAQILSDLSTAKLVLKLVRDVSRDEMNDALTESFRRAAGSNYGALRGKMQQLSRMVPDVHNGDEFSFSIADGKTVVEVNGRRVGVIEGLDFARPFLAIWIGSNPPNRGLKRGRLGGRSGAG